MSRPKTSRPVTSGPPVTSASESEIATDALRYKGVPYIYGRGGPPSVGWDCSGFVNWVLGHDLGMTLPAMVPGGPPIKNFNGSWHGPVVVNYAAWTKATTIKGPPSAGDLCIWPGIGPGGHIGIATGPDTMISALNPSLGTMVTQIQGAGPSGVPLMFRRVDLTGVSIPAGLSALVGNTFTSGCASPVATGAAGLITGGMLWLRYRKR